MSESHDKDDAVQPAGAFASTAEPSEMRRAFSTLLENVPGMAYRCRHDRDYTMEFVSQKACQLTGYPPEALVGSEEQAFGELIHPEDRDDVWRAVQEAIENRSQFEITYRITRADGELRWVDEYGRAIYEDGEVVALEGFITDVTEHREVQERFLQAHKMRTISRLAGDVANGFRDLLSVILTYAGFVEEAVDAESRVHEDIRKVIDAGERAVGLTRQLLKIAQESSGKVAPVNLNVELDSMREALEEITGDRTTVEYDFQDNLWLTEMGAGELDQVVLNLAANAREAMGEEGRLLLTTANVEVDHVVAQEHAELEAGEYVRLQVIDDGEGMERATRQKAFEPYFTTKQDHATRTSGAGLGLTTCYGIIRNRGGTIDIDSEPGRGTKISVYVPHRGDSDGLREGAGAADGARNDGGDPLEIEPLIRPG